MLKFNAYTGSQLQTFMAILNQCEAAGVNDVRFVRESIQRSLDEAFKEAKVRQIKMTIQDRKELPSFAECPSCGKKTLKPASNFKGVACRCGYSKMEGLE